MPDFQFQAGDIIFVSDNTITSALIKDLQRDFDYSHVCMARNATEILTTGAGGPPTFKFGVVNAADYLKDKKYKVMRYKGLTAYQAALAVIAENLLIGKWYNFAGLLWLNVLGMRPGVVHSLGNPGRLLEQWSVYCAEAVSYGYRRGPGIVLNEKAGKTDETAETLASIYYSPQLETIYSVE